MEDEDGKRTAETQVGEHNPGYRPEQAEVQEITADRIHRTRGYISTWKGMTMAATKAMNSTVDQTVLLRTSTQAHMDEKSTITISEITVIRMLSRNAPR